MAAPLISIGGTQSHGMPQQAVFPKAKIPKAKVMRGALTNKVAMFPAPQSMGALLGYLFGRMLEGADADVRNAAIGAAAYDTAKKEVQKLPTVFGGMPMVPVPDKRMVSL
jgi:hypothetical protein